MSFNAMENEKKPVQNVEVNNGSTGTSEKSQGKGLIIYKDMNMIIWIPIIVIVSPFFAILEDRMSSGNNILLVICEIAFVIGALIYHKYLRGGIIIDLNRRVISFTKVDLSALFKPFPRYEISFNDITGIQSTDNIQIERKSNGEFKTTSSGEVSIIRTYKFTIVGTFGTKTISFRKSEKRDQFYSIIAAYGNFS